MAQRILFGLILVAALIGCSKPAEKQQEITVPVANQPNTEATLGEVGSKFEVIGNDVFVEKQASLKIVSATSARGLKFLKGLASNEVIADVPGDAIVQADSVTLRSDSLTLGFPKGLLKEQQLFGGVITAVSDKESENLGGLKLSDVPPVHVRSVIVENKGKYAFVLAGCDQNCGESSEQKNILTIPILGIDDVKGLIYLDVASIGDKMNLVEMLDPTGGFTKLKTKTSKMTAVDYSTSTLVFDVEASMIPVVGTALDTTETKFTTRWYLRLNSAFNPGFVSRLATPGVGFFMTDRATPSRVQRWAIPFDGSVSGDDSTVKYFIKNVPDEVKAAFKASFDAWNDKFVEVIGRKLLSYEFLSEKDEKAKFLVPGDVRYKILEWDLVNRAPYGGLGPSIANQFTGEMLTANVLIQGPHIMVLYKTWFEAGKAAEELRANGQGEEADLLLANTARTLKQQVQGERIQYKLSVGSTLNFKMHSEESSLEDPLMQRDDFEPLPKNVTFANYMNGYFRDMVTHELGHNMGLRHNFRGNLSAASGAPQQDKVSGSVMEYLGRGFRYLDGIGSYDVMALKYGYTGVLPEVKNSFCTDEDVAGKDNLKGSAECSRDDATDDPYGFFADRLSRAVDLLTGRVLGSDPVWSVADMDKELTTYSTGIGLYGLTAGTTAASWTNFFGKSGRPQTKEEVRRYSLDSLLGQICDPKLAEVADRKQTEAGKAKVLENVKALKTKVSQVLVDLGYLASETQCAGN